MDWKRTLNLNTHTRTLGSDIDIGEAKKATLSTSEDGWERRRIMKQDGTFICLVSWLSLGLGRSQSHAEALFG